MLANVQKFIILSPLSKRNGNNFTATSVSVGGLKVDVNETRGSSINRANDTVRYVTECVEY